MFENPEHTSTFKLFHYYIKCSISASFGMQKRAELVGSATYANDAEDIEASSELMKKQHTVVEMAELFHRGATVIINDPKESVRIYEWLQDHLLKQRNHFATNINVGKIPLEDLAILDDFAASIYKIARGHEKVDSRVGAFGRKIRKVSNSRLPKRIERKTVNEKPAPIKEHNSISSDINRLAISRTLPNKRGR